ncbi:MAG: lamin tail domain-containing protein, partial [Calditrichota bacterium]
EIGSGSYVVYSGDGSSVTVTGLSQNTAYYARISNTLNGSNWSKSQASENAETDGVVVAAGDIMISEILQNPDAVSDANGEWFEVYNTTSSAIDINGWIIKDDDSDSHTISNGGALEVPANGFLVLARNGNISTNGGVTVDYQYSGFTLGNSADEVVLLLSDGTTEIDRIEYDGGPNWPDPNGEAMVYTGTPSGNNNDPNLWGRASVAWSGSSGDLGSPGTQGGDQALPVVLNTFVASVNPTGIEVRWITQSEIDNEGFELLRAVGEEEPDEYVKIADYVSSPELLGQGNSNTSVAYAFQDSQILQVQTYWYKLVAVDFNGQRTTHPATRVTVSSDLESVAVVTPQLFQNYPNPFNPSTTIEYFVPEDAAVQLIVYNVLGQEVRRLIDGSQGAGLHSVRWYGDTALGEQAASGIYVYRLRIGSWQAVGRMMLSR